MSDLPPAPPPRWRSGGPAVLPPPPPKPGRSRSDRRAGRVEWIAGGLAVIMLAAAIGAVAASRSRDRAALDVRTSGSAAASASASPSPSPTGDVDDYVFEQAGAGWSAFAVFTMTPSTAGYLGPCYIDTFDGRGAYISHCLHARRFVLFEVAIRTLRPGRRVMPRDLFTFTDDRGRRYAPVDATPILARSYLLPAWVHVRDSQWVSGWLAFRVDRASIVGASLSYGPKAAVWFPGEHGIVPL